MKKEYTETDIFEELEQESLESEIKIQAILDYKKEERKKIQNLKIKFKQKIIIAAFAGFGLGIAICKGPELFKNAVAYIIEADNEAVAEESKEHLEEVSKATGKTKEEILGQPTPDYDKLREEAKEDSKTDEDRLIEKCLEISKEEQLNEEIGVVKVK